MAHYRRQSMRHHPDRGGDARMFVELQRARDVLAGRG
jgi:curved DNA-binding protein CbpA